MFRKFFLTVVLCTVSANPNRAQTNTSALFTLQSLGARPVALGESYVAVSGDVHGIYWNPASLVTATGLHIAFTHRPALVADLFNFEYFAGVYKIGSKAALGASFNYMDLGTETIFDIDGRSRSFHTFSYAAGVSYAYQLTNDLSAGVTLKSIFQNLGPAEARSWAVDLGLIHALGDFLCPPSYSGQLSVGASLSNLGILGRPSRPTAPDVAPGSRL